MGSHRRRHFREKPPCLRLLIPPYQSGPSSYEDRIFSETESLRIELTDRL
jgi:hypothetical protein